MVKGSVEARRERILKATANLIRRDGVAALTTKRVAAEAECAEGTIFRHFGGKGGLIAAVLSFGLPEIDHLEQVASRKPSGDLVVDLTDLCTATLDFYRASYPIAASALTDATMFQRYRDAHNARNTGPRQIWELIHRYLRTAAGHGIIDTALDLEAEALAIAGACQNAVWVALVNGDEALPHQGRDIAGDIARVLDDAVRDGLIPINPAKNRAKRSLIRNAFRLQPAEDASPRACAIPDIGGSSQLRV